MFISFDITIISFYYSNYGRCPCILHAQWQEGMSTRSYDKTVTSLFVRLFFCVTLAVIPVNYYVRTFPGSI